jgi:hypothetical protein
MAYLLDANVFIQAKRQYYGFDICPGFWESLRLHYENARVKSIDRVKTIELERGNDELKVWAFHTIARDFFEATDGPDVFAQYAEAMRWVNNQARFTPTAKATYAESVDGWLIAYARTHNLVLVTHEERAPESRTRVHIPDVCEAVGVEYQNTFQMLRALETRFILPGSS